MILVTGHEGYIGSRLVKRLGSEAFTISGDLLDIDWKTYPLIDGIDTIIHLAALTGVRASLDKPQEYYRNNYELTKELMDYAARHELKFIYASSSNAKEWWTNPYAVTKKMTEQYAASLGHKTIGMRFHTVWPGRPDMLYHNLQQGNITYINANHYRDYIHVEDLLNAICTIVENYGIIEECVVDIGTGKAVSVLQVATEMGFSGEIRNDPTPYERTRTEAEIDWLLSLNWKPTRDILYK
jgi:nucleoside-diphosphate-sugar epimerase